MFAAENGHMDIVQGLIQATANVNQEISFDNTPLFIATHNGQTKAGSIFLIFC